MKTKGTWLFQIIFALLSTVLLISPFNDAVAADTPSTPLGWGSNASGQLGYPNPVSDLSPDSVFGLGPGSGVVATAAGGGHSLALKLDGTVLAWGGNAAGQLGDGTLIERLTPVPVSGLGAGSGVVAIATAAPVGGNHSLALKSDHTVLAWGNNAAGQLGDGTTTQRLTPVHVFDPADPSGVLSGVVAIAAGGSYSLALKFDGTTLAWGSNATGELGDGSFHGQLTPSPISGLRGIVGIAAGGGHNLAIQVDGTVWAWGNNAIGQLGDGTTTTQFTPVPVSGLGAGRGVVAIAAGGNHSLALKSDGMVLAWGSNSQGQLGDGTTTGRLTPVPVTGLGAGSGVVAIAAGGTHSLALKSDGTVLAWGSNANGRLGDGTTTQRTTPVSVSGLGFGSGVIAIAAGIIHSLALKFDGTVLAWGGNAAGQLGDGTITQRLTPVPVSSLGIGSAVMAIAAPVGGSHSLALKSDGTVWAWGNNAAGQLGDGTTIQRLTPVQVIDPGLGVLTGVVTITVGAGYCMALKSDGTVLAWGANAAGQLGDGTLTGRLAPVQVSGLGAGSGAGAIAAGNLHSLALFPLAIGGLREIVDGLTLHPNIKGGLLGKLDEAQKALDRGNTRVAENKLEDFVDQVEAQRGKALTDAQADLLVAYANALISLI